MVMTHDYASIGDADFSGPGSGSLDLSPSGWWSLTSVDSGTWTGLVVVSPPFCERCDAGSVMRSDEETAVLVRLDEFPTTTLTSVGESTDPADGGFGWGSDPPAGGTHEHLWGVIRVGEDFRDVWWLETGRVLWFRWWWSLLDVMAVAVLTIESSGG